MCGVVGVLRRNAGSARTTATAIEAELARMLAASAHRGPDAQGTWSDPDAGLWLGHRRLAIVDLTPTGSQPMASHDGRWVASYNGEVYGYQQVRRSLEASGVRFRGTSDTEVLVESVARYGVVRALERLNAMYGLALWDRRNASCGWSVTRWARSRCTCGRRVIVSPSPAISTP